MFIVFLKEAPNVVYVFETQRAFYYYFYIIGKQLKSWVIRMKKNSGKLPVWLFDV